MTRGLRLRSAADERLHPKGRLLREQKLTAHFLAMCPLQSGSRFACFAPPALKILKVAARRAAPYEASTSINNNILKVSGWLTVSHFGTGFLMTQLGLGLVWLGLAAGAFVGIIAFSNGSAWFGLGLGLVWLGLAAGAFAGRISFSNGSAWFGC